MVSNASDDLPEPDRPVMTISLSRGRSRSMFLRLCVRAPRMRIVSMSPRGVGGRRGKLYYIKLVRTVIAVRAGQQTLKRRSGRVWLNGIFGQFLADATNR